MHHKGPQDIFLLIAPILLIVAILLAILLFPPKKIVKVSLPPEKIQDMYKKTEAPKTIKLELSYNQPVTVDEYKLEINFVNTGLGINNKRYVDLDLNYSERDRYDGKKWGPGSTGWQPNPIHYSDLETDDLLRYSKLVYRTHRLCTGPLQKELGNNGKEILELSGGYKNYVCRNRFYEQCIADGSFDCYYDESCDYGAVRFFVGEIKRSTEFAIKILDANNGTAKIEISYIGRSRYEPINIEK